MKNNFLYLSIIVLLMNFMWVLSLSKVKNIDAIAINFSQPMNRAFFEKDSLKEGHLLFQTKIKGKDYFFESYNDKDEITNDGLALLIIMNNNRYLVESFKIPLIETDQQIFDNAQKSAKYIDDIGKKITMLDKNIHILISYQSINSENKDIILEAIMKFITKKNNAFSYAKFKKPFEMLTEEERGMNNHKIDVNVFIEKDLLPPLS